MRPMRLYRHGGSTCVVLPAAICRAKHLEPGQWVIVGLRSDGSVSVERLPATEADRCHAACGESHAARQRGV